MARLPMGSASIRMIGTLSDGHLHVARDEDGVWWCVGGLGSYGGAHSRDGAVRIARDVLATAPSIKLACVHTAAGRVEYTIKRVRQPPTPQHFQDDVE